MKRKAIFLAVASLFVESTLAQSPAANALPDVIGVVKGAVSFGTPALDAISGRMKQTATQTTDRALVDMRSADIGKTAWFDVSQPSTSSVFAGRVPDATAKTVIDGMLTSNGHVMLINGSGVLFGSSAIVNVASLTATTGQVNEAAFDLGSTAPIVVSGASAACGLRPCIENQGNITISNAGLLAFVAPWVASSGTITAVGGRIVLAGAQAATLTLNDGLYEIAVTQGVAASKVDNTGALQAAGGTIVLSALDAANLVSGAINLDGIQQATRIEVNGGVVELKKDLEATTVAGSSGVVNVYGGNGAQLQDAVDIAKVGTPGAGAIVNVNGTFDQQVILNKANMTLHGQTGARITVPDLAQVNAVTIAANNVTISGLEIAGPASSSYLTYPWGSNISRGIVVGRNVTGFSIADNDLHDLRTGILIDGIGNTGSVMNNRIENTKSGISVQYTDAAGITISDNTQGTYGNEWGINLHLNGFWDGGVIQSPNPFVAGAPSATWQQALLAFSTSNNGWAVQDQGYASSNRTHVTVKASGSSANQGSPLAPLNTIQAGINAVVSGGKVKVEEGTFAESLSIKKALTLTGAGKGKTIIDPVSGDVIVISDNIGAAATVTIKDLTLQGGESGIQVKDNANLGTLTLDGIVVRDNAKNGLITSEAKTVASTVANVNILNSVFAGNGIAGGSADINLFFFNGNALIKNVDILGTRGSASNLAVATDYGIQLRGFGDPSHVSPAGTMRLEDVRIAGNYRRALLGIQRYSDASLITMSGVQLGGARSNVSVGAAAALGVTGSKAGFGNFFSSEQQGALSLGDTVFLASDSLLDINLGNATSSMRVNAASVTFKDAGNQVRTDNFAIEDRVVHAIDSADSGLVTWNPGHLYVTGTTASGGIQRAINVACDCTTVHVGPGTFAEQLTINRDLILVGAGSDQTIIKPNSLTADSLGMKSILTISGAGTKAQVSGFKFMGPIAEINAGIFVRDGADANIHHNSFVDIRDPFEADGKLSGVQRGVGIFVGRASLGTSGTALIENNFITGYQKGGIVVDGPGSDATIRGNTVIGAGPTDKIAQNGIQASRGASAKIEGNTVSGNNYNKENDDTTAAGILIFTPGANLAQGEITVGANDVQHNEIGLWTNDPRSLTRVNLSGISNNEHNAVADYGGGYAGQANLEYPAWVTPNAALVNGGAFTGKDSGDMIDAGGSLKVVGYNAFATIQTAVDAVASGARIDVAAGTYGEDVTVRALRTLAFNDATLASLTLESGATDSGIGGRVTANGAGFLFKGRTFLLGDTSLTTTGANIRFEGDIQGTFSLSLNAGSGDVFMKTGGSSGNPLGRLEIDANNFTLESTLWVTGYDINALGMVALSNHSLHSVGGGGTDAINAGGDVTGTTTSTSGVQIQSAGDVAANVTSQAAVVVEAANVSGSYSAPTIAFQAQETVNVAVNATGPVQVTSGGPSVLSGSAPVLELNTSGGQVSGNFGQVTNSGSGLIVVNDRPQVNTTIAETASNNRVVPQEVTTGASREASGPPTVTRRRRKPEDALDMLENGESIEIDLTPG